VEIYEGEIVVLVGPSGCGKTTTMKMVNRLIEPTSGRIFLEGEDVTKVNSDNLRRRIGYVIQQIGLFPHMTIADNIVTVPKMLGWDNKRISDRIDERADAVGARSPRARVGPGYHERRACAAARGSASLSSRWTGINAWPSCH
jgi:osmoprotectant transport system ATP-binding protein